MKPLALTVIVSWAIVCVCIGFGVAEWLEHAFDITIGGTR